MILPSDTGNDDVYPIRRAPAGLVVTADGNAPAWRTAAAVPLRFFHRQSSDHRPRTLVRLLYDNTALLLRFTVEDQYIRSVHTRFMDPVCTDSCVEFFVQPRPNAGYINFEINAGGTLLASRVMDPRRTAGGSLADARPLTPEEAASIEIASTLPAIVEPEIVEPTTWSVCARIPISIFLSDEAGARPAPGVEWRGNFYKCGDHTSHPHWASWRPIGDALNFHCPEYFGRLRFE
jgi:hypothetical protein